MKKAWIENDQIRDIAIGDPASLYHPDVAAFYDTDVPDEAQNGDGWVNGQIVPRPIPEPVIPEPVTPEVVYPTVSAIEFKLLFTSPERIAIKDSVDPVVQDFFSLIEDPRLTSVCLGLKSTQDSLAYLEAVAILAPGRKAEILAGTAS
jgi:hypothetical protein